MRLSDTDFTQTEREMLGQVMENGEDILWCGRPDGRFPLGSCIPVFLFSLVWIAVPAYMMYMSIQENGIKQMDEMLLFPMFFVIVGILLFVGAVRYFSRRRQAVYVLTEQRAILLEPKLISGVKVFTYPLVDDMLLEVNKKKDGSGNLVFDHSDVVVNDKPLPRGFLNICDVEKPLAILRERGVKASQESFEL